MKKLLIILLGFIFVGLGIFLIIQSNNLAKRCTESAVATVVDITREVSTDDDGFDEYTYFPVIEYKVDEQTISKKDGHGSNPSKYQVNDTINILYNPENVEEYIIEGDSTSNIIGIVFIVLGAIVVLAGGKQILFGR